MRKASVLFVAMALSVFGLAACGDDGNDEDTTAATTVEETTAGGGGATGATLHITAAADGSFAYDQTSLASKPGTVTIDFDNPASLAHDVTIADESGDVLGATDLITDSTTSTTVDLNGGTYTFYCSVPGHREGGMEGTLTVD
jgi:plastocyanin